MPCKQQLSDLVLCIVSQGKTGDSFHISYKNNLLTCGYVQFSCGGEAQTALHWDTGSAFGFCLPSPRSLAGWCRSGRREFRIRPWFTAQQKQEGTGIISLGKILNSASPAREESPGAPAIQLSDDSFNPCLRFFCEQPSRLLLKTLYANRPSLSLIFFSHQHITWSVTPRV